MRSCSICSILRKCRTITIDKGEGAALGLADGTEFHYCGPCWSILQEKHTAASLLQGQTVALLRSMGYGVSETAAQHFHEKLMALGVPRN